MSCSAGSWHDTARVEEPASFPLTQDTLLGSNREPAPLPEPKAGSKSYTQSSVQHSAKCDQTTSSSISIKHGKFKSGNVLLPEKHVHVVLP